MSADALRQAFLILASSLEWLCWLGHHFNKNLLGWPGIKMIGFKNHDFFLITQKLTGLAWSQDARLKKTPVFWKIKRCVVFLWLRLRIDIEHSGWRDPNRLDMANWWDIPTPPFVQWVYWKYSWVSLINAFRLDPANVIFVKNECFVSAILFFLKRSIVRGNIFSIALYTNIGYKICKCSVCSVDSYVSDQ